jgi:DNA-binding Lrp family transcriptional regulator
MSLDRIDFEILTSLQKDARLSNKELAIQVGIAPSTCFERVKRLRKTRALRGFHATVDPAALGIGLHALISVRLGRHSREVLAAFWAHAEALDEVIAIYHLAGATDFLFHVAVPDVEALRCLALDAFTSRAEVEHLDTALVFDHRVKSTLPNYAQPD